MTDNTLKILNELEGVLSVVGYNKFLEDLCGRNGDFTHDDGYHSLLMEHGGAAYNWAERLVTKSTQEIQDKMIPDPLIKYTDKYVLEWVKKHNASYERK